MTKESNLLYDLWEVVSDKIPVKQRQEMAIDLVRVMSEYYEFDDLKEIRGEDGDLSKAFDEIFEEELSLEEEEEDFDELED